MSQPNEITSINSELQKNIDGLLTLKAEFEKLVDISLQLKVSEEISLALAQQQLATINSLDKDVADKFKGIKKPYWNACKFIDQHSGEFSGVFAKGIKHLKDQIKAYVEKQNEYAKAIEEKITVQIKPRGVRYTWTYELVDKTQLSPEWTTIDTKVVSEYLSENKESLKDGEVVNGVKFYKKMTITA